MAMKTIRLTGGVLGPMEMKVRCDLARAESSVQVDYCEGSGWQGTQYQCADARHRTEGLAELAQKLACDAVQEPYSDETRCDCEDVQEEIQEENRTEYGDRTPMQIVASGIVDPCQAEFVKKNLRDWESVHLYAWNACEIYLDQTESEKVLRACLAYLADKSGNTIEHFI